MKATIAIAVLAATLAVGNAQAGPSDEVSTPWVTHYGAGEGFYHVVADKRFVGYFVPKKNACSVSVLVGPADEHDTSVKPMQLTVDVKPLQSLLVRAGRRQSLDIACGLDAGALAIRTVSDADAGLAPTN